MARPLPVDRVAPLVIEISSDEESEDEVVFLNSPPRRFATVPRQHQPRPERNQQEEGTIANPGLPFQQPEQPQMGLDLDHFGPVFDNNHSNAPNLAYDFDTAGMDLRDFLADRNPHQFPTNAGSPLSSHTALNEPITEDPITEDVFSARLLDIFPDIALDHLSRLFNDGATQGTCSEAWTNQVIHLLLDEGKYPRERDRRHELKRKREEPDEDAEFQQYETTNREAPHPGYRDQADRILRLEFPEVPVKYIIHLLKTKRFLFPTFVQLYEDEQNYSSNPQPPFKKVKSRMQTKENKLRSTDPAIAANVFGHSELSRELEAAKKKTSKNEARRHKEKQKAEEEEQNERTARANNAITDCGCCFTETPNNRMTFCSAQEPHYFCLDCARKYVQSLIGDSKCSTLCMDFSGCQAPFARDQLKSFLDTKTFEKLEHMQQQEDIRLAGLDDLVECPFCDFKAVYPPVEDDKEFRCQNPDCEKVSCRLCSRETHIPLSCEENEKDNMASLRHTMEEAMTEALVRTCNNCKNKFIKEFGCNKMTCPRCGNRQCYVCSENIKDYTHFERGKCQMNDDTHTRHQQEVSKAEKEARRKLLASNPDLTNEDLDIKVSTEVKRDEQQRNVRNFPPAFPLGRVPPNLFGMMQPHPNQMGPGYGNPFGPPQVLPPALRFGPPQFVQDFVFNQMDGPNMGPRQDPGYGEAPNPPPWLRTNHHPYPHRRHLPPPPHQGQRANPPTYPNWALPF